MASATLAEKWLLVEQIAHALSGIARKKAELSALGEPLKLNDASFDAVKSENDFKLACKGLMKLHGRDMVPQAKFTLVTKEANAAGRHYRLGEYRLFIGQWGTVVVKCQPTDDQLDIDPTVISDAFYVVNDEDMRRTEDATELKNMLKQFVQTLQKGSAS